MKPFPLYQQHDQMDCGPTCLRMIAKFYGKQYSLESLREISHLSREGVSMLGISAAAEKIGFRTMGACIAFEQLCQAPLPCIVHWNHEHFVVVYKIKKHSTFIFRKQTSNGDYSIFVADPGGSKVVYNKEEFCRCWLTTKRNNENKGFILALEPTPEFYETSDNQKSNRKNFGFFFNYLIPHQKLLFQLFLGLLMGSILQLIFPFLTQSVVDFGISNNNLKFIYLVLIAQLVLTLGSSVVGLIQGWILLHMGTRINISLISDFLSKLMRLPMSYFDTKMVGDLLQRIGDHSRIQSFLTGSSLSLLFSFFNLIVFSFVLCFYNWQLFLIFLIGSIFYFLWIWMFMKKRAELDHKMFSQNASNQSNIVQLITGMQEIKLNGCEQQKRWEWERIQAKLFRLNIKGLALGQYQDSGAMLINQAKNILSTIFVAQMVVEGEMTLGMMISVQYIIGQLNGPVNQLIGFMHQTQDAKLSLERLNEVHQKDDEEKIDIETICNIPKGRNIFINKLTFAYEKLTEEKVLNSIQLEIIAGKQTAIVGLSGSGKTTLIKLLLGYYLPDKGEIKLGNTKLENYSIREWRKKCGIVMQEGFIFSDTIANNIAPGEEIINKEKLYNAVSVANIREFIESLPLAYNTKIGNEGHGLSQGQKQRILIARAVYKNPEFIFFDEATNALDANNERTIMDNLQVFFEGKTVIVVAHRLSTVRNADKIIVLDKGQIAEQGTHDELLDLKGKYYQLVKNQLNI